MRNLLCDWCGEQFTRPHMRGPEPKYCSAAHRQAAHRHRQATPEDQIIKLMKAIEMRWQRNLKLIATNGTLALVDASLMDGSAIPEEAILAWFPRVICDGGDPEIIYDVA